MIEFQISIEEEYRLVQFKIKEGLISPEDLANLIVSDTFHDAHSDKGIVLSGRGPIWLFAYLSHHFHPSVWVATYDPRLKAAVIVQSHSLERKVGDLIQLPERNWTAE